MELTIKRIFAMLIACSVTAGVCVIPSYAEDTSFTAECKVEDGVYSIAGSGNERFINVIIMPDGDAVDSITDVNFERSDYIAFSIENNADSFKKSFNLPQDFPDGEYKSVLWGGSENLELYFMSGNEDYKNELLGKKIKDGNLDEVIERYGEQYEINVKKYENLKQIVKDDVSKKLAQSEITDFTVQYKESVLEASFNHLETTQEVYDLLAMLNTDFTYYNKLSEDKRQSVLLKLLKNLPNTSGELKNLAERYSKEAYQNTGTNSANGSHGGSVKGPSGGSALLTQPIGTTATSAPVSQPFSDISGHWAEKNITELAEKGIVSGGDGGKFYPENNITRAEFAKMLIGIIGIHKNEREPQHFSDVSAFAWYYEAVSALCEQGIIFGYEDGTFRPENNITRQDMAVMIYRILEQRGIEPNDKKEFSDKSEISEYALNAVLCLGGEGIISGFDGGIFKPADLLTRAEAASVILRVYNKIENADTISGVKDIVNAGNSVENGAAEKQSQLVKTEITKREARAAESEQLIAKLLNRPMRGVTRAGFISDVSDLINPVNTKATEQYFTDLPLSREETSSIQAMADRGFIPSEGEFKPDDAITVSDAIQVMVCALGYKEFAAAAGYMKAADKAELWYGVQKSMQGELAEETAKLMLLNMLQSRVVTIGTINGVSVELKTAEKSLLEEMYGIYESTGILEETTLNSLKRTGIDKELNVTVDGKKYFANEDSEDYFSYLGCHVNVYYTEDNDLFMLAKTEKNKTVTFPVDSASMQDNLTVLYDDENNKKSYKYKLNEDYYFLYNGALSTRTPGQVLSETDDGIVEMMDNNNDGKYDIITIKKPEYIVVDSISKINRVIYDKNSSENMIDLFDDEIISHIEGRNGQKIRFLDISGGEIYEVYITEDKKFANLKQMNKILAGSPTSRNQNGITIDGTVYKTTGYFDKYYSDILKLGNDYSFIVSSDGKLISFSASGNTMKFGYVKAVGWEEGREDEEMFIRLFTQDNKFENYKVKNKLKVDGKSTKIDNLYGKLLSNGEVNHQLIRYSTDENGEIKVIDFAEINSTDKIGEKKVDDNSLTEYKFSQASFYYKDSVDLMYPSFNVSGSMVFVIPNDINDKDTFRVTNSSFFADCQSYSNLKVYNLSENGTAEAVVVRSDTLIPSLSKYASSFVVEEVQEVWNEDEDEVMMRVSGWEDQKYRSYWIDKDISILKASGEKLGFGDVIRFYNEGEIIKYMVCDFDANENVFARNNIAEAAAMNGGNQDVMYQLGATYMLGGGYIYIGGGDNGKDMSLSAIRNFSTNTQNVAVIDMNDRTVRTGTLSDIRTYKNYGAGDVVLIRQANLFTRAIYVYVW